MKLEKLIEFFIEDVKADLREIKDDAKELRSKVDQLLQFKWQIIGGSIVLSFLVSVAFHFIEVLTKP